MDTNDENNEVLQNVKQQTESRLESAKQTATTFDIERQQNTKSHLNSDKGFGRRAVEALPEGFKASAAETLQARVTDAVVESGVGKSIDAVAEVLTGVPLSEDTISFIGDLTHLGERWEDPNWKPREEGDQKEWAKGQINRLGLPLDGDIAQSLLDSSSKKEAIYLIDRIEQNKESIKTLQELGPAGQLGFVVGSFADIDAGIGGSLMAANRVNKATKMLNAAKKAGLEDKYVQYIARGNTKSRQILESAEIGAASGLLVEGTNAFLEPHVGLEDVVAATVASSLFSGTLGSVSKTKTQTELIDDVVQAKMYKAVVNAKNNVDRTADFNSAYKFTEQAEGGYANNPADRGGETMMGISSKNFPDQFKEVMKIHAEKGVKAAKRYSRDFYRKNFWDKVVTKDMTPEMAKAVFDTAVHSGVGRAKKLYAKSKGDFNTFITERAKFLDNIIKNDPTQSTFAAGWSARLRNLRDSVKGENASKNTRAEGVESRPEQDTDTSEGVTTPDVELDPESALNQAAGNKLREAEEFFLDNEDLDSFLDNFETFVEPGATGAKRLSQEFAEKSYKAINKTLGINDWERAIKEGGTAGRYIAYHVAETAVGTVVNNKNAAAVGDDINRTAARLYTINAPRHYNKWRKRNGIKWWSKENATGDAQDKFGREIYKYQTEIDNGRTPKEEDFPEEVVSAAKDIDAANESMLNALKKHNVEGFKDVDFKAGYLPRSWSGTRISLIENTPGVGKNNLVDSLVDAIQVKNPDVDPLKARVMALAIRRHGLGRMTNNPIGSHHILNTNAKLELEQLIIDNGLDVGIGKSAKEIVDTIVYQKPKSNAINSAKDRVDLDLSTPIRGTDKTLLDLVNTDAYGLMDRQMRGQASYAGLASVGIQKSDVPAWIRAAREEAIASGKNPEKAEKAVSDLLSYFTAGAFGEGVNAGVQRLNKLAIMSFLPQLGVTQISEAGVAMTTGGLKAYSHYMGKTLPAVIKGREPEVIADLMGGAGYLGDHKHWVNTDHLDERTLMGSSPFWNKLDRMADKGLKGMGYISGFHKMNEGLHSVAALTMNNYMVKAIRDNKHSARLDSMGVTPEFRALIKEKLEAKVIEFSDNGHVSRMNTLQWNPGEVELLRIITRRNMDQTVQKARKGEAHAWQYNSLGALLSSLKSFTMIAAQKQLIRNTRLADPEAFMMLLYTTATAGLAVTASKIVNGDTERLGDMEYLAKATLNWSPMLGPAMMGLDATTYLLGADQIEGSPFPLNSWRYNHDGLLSLPAGVAAFNELAKIPLRVPMDAIMDGKLERDSTNALRAIPIIGRAYLTKPLIDQLEQD